MSRLTKLQVKQLTDIQQVVRQTHGALIPFSGQKSSLYRAGIRDPSLKLHKLIFCNCMVKKKPIKAQEGPIHVSNIHLKELKQELKQIQ